MLAKLIYDGKVDLNEPVKNLLPVHLNQSSFNGKEITLVHLANHTSGLPFEPTNVRDNTGHPFDPYNPYRYYDTTRLYDYLSHQMTLQSTPGEKRTYSNLGGGLLGHILTLISAKSYEELLFETVCKPLRMRNTFVTLNDERKRSMGLEALRRRTDLDALIGLIPRASFAGFVSQYKNLLNHYVHQHGHPDATTFWSACGAIRRDVFRRRAALTNRTCAAVEDIHFGYRLRQASHRIALDGTIQVTHLKRWTLGSCCVAIFRPALPGHD